MTGIRKAAIALIGLVLVTNNCLAASAFYIGGGLTLNNFSRSSGYNSMVSYFKLMSDYRITSKINPAYGGVDGILGLAITKNIAFEYQFNYVIGEPAIQVFGRNSVNPGIEKHILDVKTRLQSHNLNFFLTQYIDSAEQIGIETIVGMGLRNLNSKTVAYHPAFMHVPQQLDGYLNLLGMQKQTSTYVNAGFGLRALAFKNIQWRATFIYSFPTDSSQNKKKSLFSNYITLGLEALYYFH